MFQVADFTGKSPDEVSVALHDCNYDTEYTINSLLEGRFDQVEFLSEWEIICDCLFEQNNHCWQSQIEAKQEVFEQKDFYHCPKRPCCLSCQNTMKPRMSLRP